MHVSVERIGNGFNVTANPGMGSSRPLRQLCVERATGEPWAGAAARAAELAKTAFDAELVVVQDQAREMDKKEARA